MPADLEDQPTRSVCLPTTCPSLIAGLLRKLEPFNAPTEHVQIVSSMQHWMRARVTMWKAQYSRTLNSGVTLGFLFT
jgi:hypothetical protein